ncbi:MULTISPECIES: universal stress protein [unclassified Bradyrhizobium]|uniref:universal stress protein n=1 Tax=unclassified Bradyrhizobium TaxID=2631580 RepID=UPI00263B4ED0|nr:universal stress protein [Bradyrhizobium sp. WYCCWR 12677]
MHLFRWRGRSALISNAIAAGDIQPGIAFAADGVVTGVAAVFEMEQERATERSAAALTVFETEARKAEIPYGCRSTQDLPAEAASAVGAAARVYDLTVALQPDMAQDSFDNATSTQILLQAGGPTLMIPHIFKGVFRPRRIGICWDGSRYAARALRDAKPLLSRAEAAVVISINEAQVAPAEASAQSLMKHMGRSEIATTLLELTAERSEIQPLILSLAADKASTCWLWELTAIPKSERAFSAASPARC